MKGYTAFGGMLGGVWWVIRDLICVTHESDTYSRHLLSYALMGGVIVATTVHPVNFIFGFLAGGVFGAVKTDLTKPPLPRNF